MNVFDDLKFMDENSNEYFIGEKLVIDEELYCVAINLNDATDMMFINIDNVDGNMVFNEIKDSSIISKLREKLYKNS